jgi:hypothetical protein
MRKPGKFCNVVLQRDGENQMYHVRSENVLQKVKVERNILQTIKIRKTN